jgi:hypothetical protein
VASAPDGRYDRADPMCRESSNGRIDWNWMPPGQQLLFAGVARDFDKYVVFNLEGRVNSIETLIPRYRRALREFGAKLLITDGQIHPAHAASG